MEVCSNLSEIIQCLPPQVYLRRGELIIHFSNPADLIARLVETAGILEDLATPDVRPADRQARGRRPRASGSANGAGLDSESTTSRSQEE